MTYTIMLSMVQAHYTHLGMNIVPEDVDVILSPASYTSFVEFAKSKGVEADKLGEYELVVDGIDIHTKIIVMVLRHKLNGISL